MFAPSSSWSFGSTSSNYNKFNSTVPHLPRLTQRSQSERLKPVAGNHFLRN
uniref:Uncharacterized protein n=1 Tax=Anguilla anguilla TaxID=7936 RepID=A0A0E9SQW1_ANGAN